jgi:GntR family transcriptional regulator, transcriptional repressor for pyruvate dehydrogenase complex
VPGKRTPAKAPDETPANSHETKGFLGHPAARMRAADYVFETLSRAILSGEVAPGTVLATQRELSKQFAVSPLVVRQATHRLEELGLVRVRQGSTTIVLDPGMAADLRILQLQLELATPGDKLALAARENQALSTLPLLALAERRISEDQVKRLEQLIEELPEAPSRRDHLLFLTQFWGLISVATQNPMLQHQVRWWSRVMRDLEKRSGPTAMAARVAPPNLYRNLVRALRRKRGAVEVWLKVLDPLFDWTEAQPGHAVHQAASKPRAPLNKQARAAR